MPPQRHRIASHQLGGPEIAVSTTDAAHLLRRTGFGVTTARLNEITALADRNAAVARVTDLSLAPAATGAPIGGGWVEDQWSAWYRLCWWWMDRMRTSPVPIVEKMTLFWHNHFVSGQDKLYDIGLLYTQNQLFRSHALGDYHALVQGMAVDPAMLWYLDNAENRAGREQENFAREVMELFTLGQGHYTEADVITMARAWTGHNVTDDGRAYLFRAGNHDDGADKVLFGGPATNWDGPATLTEILRGTRAVPAARFVTAKLFSYLAYPVTVSDPLVATLADGFRANDLSILWLVREILRSDAFWSPTARYALVRNPTEWFVAGMEALGLPPSQCHPEWWMEGTGQQLFYPPNVAGWKQNSYWISTASGWARSGWASYVRWVANEAGIFNGIQTQSAAAIVTQAFERFGIVDPSPATRTALETWVTRAKTEGDAWSIAPNLVLLVLVSPDFQLA